MKYTFSYLSSYFIKQLLLVFIMPCLLFVMPSCDRSHNADELSHKKTNDSIESTLDTLQIYDSDGLSFFELFGVYDTTELLEKRLTLVNNMFLYLDEVDILDERIVVDSDMPTDSVEMLLNYWSAEYFYRQRQITEGLACAQRALSLAGNYDDKKFISDCESLQAFLYFSISDYGNAIECARQALVIERELEDASRLSSVLNTMAAISLATKYYDEARVYITEALHYSTSARDSTRMASQNGIASEVFYALERYDDALNYAHQALLIDSLTKNDVKKGIHLSQLASAQIAIGKTDEAESSLNQAIPLLESVGNYYSSSIARVQLGELLNTKGDYTRAVEHFDKALNVFSKMGNMFLEIRTRRGLCEALKIDNPSKALEQMESLMVLRDSLNSDEIRQTISKYNALYKNEQYAKQLELDDTRHRIELTIAISAVVLLVMLVVFLLIYLTARNRNQRSIEKLSSMRESFFTNVTHEFRTPLTIILGISSDIQKDENVPISVQRKMQIVERQGKGLLTLVTQLLDISKISSALGNPEWRHGDITTYIEMIVESYRDHAENSNIDLLFYAKDDVSMDFVPDYVSKILNNLLSNAIKFTPEYGKISVALWKENDSFIVEVADSGLGMTQETIAHVFEPFYRADTEKYVEGTGVGLALVKQIVDAVGGAIKVDSSIGRGTTFHVELPMRHEIEKQLDGYQTNIPMLSKEGVNPEGSTTKKSECRLLVVEDNRDIASYIGSHFDRQYDVIYACNGKDGLDKAIEYVPDLIITDFMMPLMNGVDMCRGIRDNDIVSHIPIVMVTAKDSDADRIRCVEVGMDAILTKPFNSEELRAVVNNILEKNRQMRQKFAISHDANIVNMPPQEPDKSSDDAVHNDVKTEQELEFIKRLTKAVETTTEKGYVDVNTIASCVKMSANQLRRKLYAITGDTPLAFIKNVQMMKAKQLLREELDLPIGDVAFRCGYTLQTHFSRAFKAYCGMSPMQWRKGMDVEHVDKNEAEE